MNSQFVCPYGIQNCAHLECDLIRVRPTTAQLQSLEYDSSARWPSIVDENASNYASRNPGTTSFSGLGPGVLFSDVPTEALPNLAARGREDMLRQSTRSTPGAMGVFQGPGMLEDGYGQKREGSQIYLHSSSKGTLSEGRDINMTPQIEERLEAVGTASSLPGRPIHRTGYRCAEFGAWSEHSTANPNWLRDAPSGSGKSYVLSTKDGSYLKACGKHGEFGCRDCLAHFGTEGMGEQGYRPGQYWHLAQREP